VKPWVTPPLQFNYVPYPLWRRSRSIPLIQPVLNALYQRVYPVDLDQQPPDSLEPMVAYLRRWDLLPDVTLNDLESTGPQISQAEPTQTGDLSSDPPPAPLRIPAPWEPLEAVILNWPAMYPPLWPMYAQMAEGIAPVAEVRITVPTKAWAHAAAAYLRARGKSDLARVVFLNMPTDDIWVRDYGPIIGLNGSGSRTAVSATYDTHPQYPQIRDDSMPVRFSAHYRLPHHPIDLRTEGGNLLTDGDGTLIMTERIFSKNPRFDHGSLIDYLKQFFVFEKLLITPRVSHETTGHVDLLAKLLRRDTVLVGEPTTPTTRRVLQIVYELFTSETNARGEHYQVITLPTLPLYYNWFFYPIRRSYTNSLTVNGRVLVPAYGAREDERALRIYADALPDYTIVPIDCKVGANGGGAVHCMTREVPASR
jgi:agmatine deiminase